MFFQGVFLKDKHQLLINAQEDKTKGLRQLRFQSIEEIDPTLLSEYIEEAIENQKQGKEVKIERNKTFKIPPLLQQHFQAHKSLQLAFEQLTPGKQKEYAAYIKNCKQEKTKVSRIQKITPMILDGIGLNDRYKKT